MKLKKVLKKTILLVLLVGLIGLIGCSLNKPIVLHPIEKSDIFSIPKGSTIKYPSGKEVEVKKDGNFLSDYYINEVMKAKVE